MLGVCEVFGGKCVLDDVLIGILVLDVDDW